MKFLRYLLSVISLFIILSSQAQEQEIMKVVQSVFDGMASNNGEMVKGAFTADAAMFTVAYDKEGKVFKRQGSLEKFAEAVSAPKDQAYNEPIWNERVEIDGALASVWVDYAFYLGNTFHHCGVDAFHLMLTDNGWKIFHLVDTRRTEDCKVPNSVKKKYED
ncbi:MAG: nuclear transport factor 2 family protein [Cytophagales bacterium]|nr:nuclear transport factor 2 family protein [Cytophagales bacterium]